MPSGYRPDRSRINSKDEEKARSTAKTAWQARLSSRATDASAWRASANGQRCLARMALATTQRGETAGGGARLAERPSEASSQTPRGEAGSYLETSKNSVDKGHRTGGRQGRQVVAEVGRHFECRGIGCKSRFCSHCCQSMGIELRKRLIPELAKWQAIMMITLTIDPKLFAGPDTAWEHVKKRRSVAELVRGLKKLGLLLSNRFVCVVEWHKNGWAHFHLLIETRYVPFDVIARLWGRNRPRSALKWEGSYLAASMKGMEPEFGTVRFSKRKFESPEHAAGYACKYLTKHPEQGYPEWVLGYRGQIKRYSTSRGLLPGRRRKVGQVMVKPLKLHDACEPKHANTCFCERCRGDVVAAPATCKPGKSCVSERVARCRTKAYLAEVPEIVLEDGDIMNGRPRFVSVLAIGFVDVLRLTGWEDIGQRAVPLTVADLKQLDWAQDHRQAAESPSRDSVAVAWQRRGEHLE